MQTEDQYQFCYRAALEYLSSFDHYTDNWQSGNVMMMMMMMVIMMMVLSQKTISICSANLDEDEEKWVKNNN